jgi:hypothetical protein
MFGDQRSLLGCLRVEVLERGDLQERRGHNFGR